MITFKIFSNFEELYGTGKIFSGKLRGKGATTKLSDTNSERFSKVSIYYIIEINLSVIHYSTATWRNSFIKSLRILCELMLLKSRKKSI